jgi:hypothetical protein
MKNLAALASVLIAIGCGGGGGGSGDPFFGGVYEVRLVAVENTCSFAVEPIDARYVVNQDGTRVVVDSKAGNVFEGTVSGDDRFIVSRVGVGTCVDKNGNDLPSSTYQFTDSLEFVFEDADKAQVTFTGDSGNCSGNTLVDVTCRFRMTGTAVRSAS